MHILKKVCYMTSSFPATHFLYDSVIISRENLRQLHVKKTVFISQHLLQSSIIASDLWLIREKLICLVEENYCSPALLKVPIYSAELATIIFV